MTFHCVPKRVFVPKKKRVHTGLGRKTEVENLPNSVVESEVYFKKKNSRDGKVYFIWKPLFADTPELVIVKYPKKEERDS